MTHQEINAARLTLAKRIIERLIEDPSVKTLRMLGVKNIGPTIISVTTEVMEAWTPGVITEEALQAALKDQEWEVRVRFILVEHYCRAGMSGIRPVARCRDETGDEAAGREPGRKPGQ